MQMTAAVATAGTAAGRTGKRFKAMPRVLLAMVLMLVVTNLPFLTALVSAPVGATFGGALSNVIDVHSHLAKMQQGFRGDWQNVILFTSEPHEPVWILTHYQALGHVARLTGLSVPLVYNLARVFFTAVMVWAIYAFLRRYLEPRGAWWALLLTLFGGGVGFVLYFIAPEMAREVAPIELWLQDGFMYLAVVTFPHFAIAITLLLISLVMIERWAEDKPGSLLVLLFTTFGISIVQPHGLPLIDLILIGVVGSRVLRGQMNFVRALRGLIVIGVFHAAIIGYPLVVLYTFPVWREFTAQNVLPSPAPIYYLLGYLPMLLPALGGIVIIIRRREERWLLPILWLALVCLLLYAPLSTQRRYTLAIQAPLAALAVYWMAQVGVPWLRRRLRGRATLVLMLYGAVCLMATALMVQAQMIAVADKADRLVYHTDDQRAAWDWISANTTPTDLFLSSFEAGGQIPAYTGRRVMLGHWIETVDYPRKRAAVAAFFDPATPDSERWALMSEQGVHYVWYGPDERALGAWSPAAIPLLRPAFESATITIYRVDWVR